MTLMNKIVSSLVLSAVTSQLAWAASIPAGAGALLPASAEPGQTQKRLTGNLFPPMKSTAIPHGAQQPQMTASQSKVRFQLNKIELSGNTVFSYEYIRKDLPTLSA